MNYQNTIKYKLFSDAPEVDLVEIEADDDVMPIGEFLERCISSEFTDYDGEGNFVKTIDGKDWAIEDIAFSIDEDELYYKGTLIGSIFYFCNTFNIKKVVWFNK